MSKQTEGKNTNKVGAFLKKNIYYILMVVAVLAIIAMIVTAAVLTSNTEQTDGPVINNDEPAVKPDDKPIVKPEENKPAKVFIIMKPVATETLGLGYSEDELVFHPTQGAWKTHLGIDYMAPAGTEVVAVFDGRVKSIDTDSYYGTCITVEHMDGFESVYKLLDSETPVKVGSMVNKGDKLGTIGNKSTFEVKQGEHMHFELTKAGKVVDPNLYFAEGDK